MLYLVSQLVLCVLMWRLNVTTVWKLRIWGQFYAHGYAEMPGTSTTQNGCPSYQFNQIFIHNGYRQQSTTLDHQYSDTAPQLTSASTEGHSDIPCEPKDLHTSSAPLALSPARPSSTLTYSTDRQHLPHLRQTYNTLDTFASHHPNLGVDEDLPSTPLPSPSVANQSRQAWIDPLLLSPLTPSSQASSPTWPDPFHDQDENVLESEQFWVDPLFENPLSSEYDSDSSEASASSSAKLSSPSPINGAKSEFQKRYSDLDPFTNQYPSKNTPASPSSMAGAKGKNVSLR